MSGCAVYQAFYILAVQLLPDKEDVFSFISHKASLSLLSVLEASVDPTIVKRRTCSQ